ncbi:MAG: SLC13 family permease [Bacillota bacterium]|jgi:di/tricarboxylate transporter
MTRLSDNQPKLALVRGQIGDRKLLSMVLGIAIFLLIWFLPLPKISVEGQKCLAISMFAVIWLANGVTTPAYTGLIVLAAFIMLMDHKIVPVQTILSGWTSSVVYMVIAGFLLAGAVSETGLGKRIALFFVSRFVHSYMSLIVFCYILNIILCVIIPHPWPRCMLLASVLSQNMSGRLPRGHVNQITLAIFAGAVSTSLMFLTGDPSFSSVVIALSETPISYTQWIEYMLIPGLFISVLACIGQLLVFRLPNLKINREQFKSEAASLGPLTGKEKRLVFWLAVAIILWLTGSGVGLDAGWVTAIIAVILSLPVVGGVLDARSLKSISVDTPLFIVAVLSIGAVSKASGMSDWLAGMLLSLGVPTHPWLFAPFAIVICMLLHMVTGSSMSAMGVIAPALISVGTALEFAPIFPALLAFVALAGHWVLPYQHMTIQIGQFQLEESFTTKEVVLLAIPQTIIILLASFVMAAWFSMVGIVR